MVDVFFLLAQELERDRIQSVTPQMIVSLDQLKKIKLDSAVSICRLCVPIAHLLAGEVCFLGLGLNSVQSGPIREPAHFRCFARSNR